MSYKINRNKYFIIGGTSKAGTTSLFNYLAGHPRICAADGKETRFFLDAQYPLPKLSHTSGIRRYEDFFKCQNEDQIRLEGSPDYLYSPNTAKLIRDSFQNIKIAFVLRDPVTRLKSYYRFGIQMGYLNKKVTFNDYVSDQFLQSESDELAVSHPTYLALRHGRYSRYLDAYYRLFTKEEVIVCFYEDMSSNPCEFSKRICKFIGLDPEYYNGYDFKIVNRTVDARYPVLHRAQGQIRALLQHFKRDKPRLQSWLARISSKMEPLYRKINIKEPVKVQIDENTMARLKEYYRDEISYFKNKLGVHPPWKIGA